MTGPDMSPPCIDVVIPAFDEETDIGRCLDHVFAQDHPPERMRVWVVDAGSTDGTADVVRARPEPALSLIAGHGRLNAGQALNLGIAAGHAELVARVDAHTYLDREYLRRAAALMAQLGPEVGLVGGQPAQVGETRFGEAVARARRSRFGVGRGSVYADRRSRADVDTVQGGVYRRSALAAVGGFGATFRAGEDEECNWRLRRAGYRVVLDTSLAFTYTTRSSWSALFRQHRNYGASRATVVARHPGYLRPRHVVPSGFVAGVTGLAMAGVASRPARRALAATLTLYGAGLGVTSVSATRDDSTLAPRVAAALTAMHLGYGIGLIAGVGSVVTTSLGLTTPRLTVTRR